MTDVEWHKLPEDPPRAVGDYLVTQHVEDFPPKVVVMHFNPNRGFSYYPDYEDELKAWAELPEPYKEPEPLDMHPDAIAARRYMENHHDMV